MICEPKVLAVAVGFAITCVLVAVARLVPGSMEALGPAAVIFTCTFVLSCDVIVHDDRLLARLELVHEDDHRRRRRHL